MALVKCRECSKELSSEAPTCPHCGAPTKKPARTIGTIPGLILAALAVWGVAKFVSTSSAPPPATAATAVPPRPNAAPNPQEPKPTEAPRGAPVPSAAASAWKYKQSTDEMSSTTAYFASIRSTNEFQLQFPYQGNQRATLTLRKHPRHGVDAIIGIERGQLLCGVSDCRLQVRFDDAKPQSWTFTGAADHDSTVLFVRDGRSFISKVASSKVTRIELQFFQSGPVVATFPTSALDVKRLSL